MDSDEAQATAGRIDAAHRAAGRLRENPPFRLARIDDGAHWAELWAAGLDDEGWYYRVSDRDPAPVLVGHDEATGSGTDTRIEPYDPLLGPVPDPIWARPAPTGGYLRAWLRYQATGSPEAADPSPPPELDEDEDEAPGASAFAAAIARQRQQEARRAAGS